ncbi:hypothetical protein A2U01_0072376, partial [Trifolium medium]|nr:hypothetical protein [Trifolium medium]
MKFLRPCAMSGGSGSGDYLSESGGSDGCFIKRAFDCGCTEIPGFH